MWTVYAWMLRSRCSMRRSLILFRRWRRSSGKQRPADLHRRRKRAAAEQGGFGLDAMWNDDSHHSALVALKGRTEAYLTDYRGAPQEFISAAKHGYLYQGQWYRWQGKRRGTPARDLPPCAFIAFLQNHDQIENSGLGRRIHQMAHPGQCRAMTALLLGPATPMLFQGQEFGASSPFLYFADHDPELAALVEKGRTEFVHQFPSLGGEAIQPHLSPPQDRQTFWKCKLDFSRKKSMRKPMPCTEIY